jgi:hypothetical protein
VESGIMRRRSRWSWSARSMLPGHAA